MTLTYVTGDATEPGGTGPRLLVHVCNDIGAWGRGFVLALSKRFPEPEKAYKDWAARKTGHPFELGEVQFVEVEPDLTVANLIGQHDIARKNRLTERPPVRYEAIRTGLKRVREEAERTGATVHMPRIGAGVAGGDWAVIAPIIEEELAAHGIAVTVYDLPTVTTGVES
ncbi:macro domain-containing protein [Deinococcus sp. SDU3-2]|uniref:Macro domain-containing protein n=1 Tax=Deinococcus terrestris TaxID=2651870 RepID=A0A7X1TRL0_9DEIO|nr:macro domain-containing protein [Deinococcus terrestris]MPY66534.1 macro domain-containing protein [Deinococcus terrestris]